MTRRPPTRPGSRHLLVAAVALLALAACGVRPETEPRPISAPHGPFQALASPTPAADPTGAVPETLYLTKDGLLAPVVRHLAQTPSIQELVADLVAGPSTPERNAGYGSALVGTNQVGTVTLADGYAIVEITVPVEGTVRNDEVLAYGQLVCTLTTQPGVSAVSFRSGGEAVKVPRGDLSLSDMPLTKADYANLIDTK